MKVSSCVPVLFFMYYLSLFCYHIHHPDECHLTASVFPPPRLIKLLLWSPTDSWFTHLLLVSSIFNLLYYSWIFGETCILLRSSGTVLDYLDIVYIDVGATQWRAVIAVTSQ